MSNRRKRKAEELIARLSREGQQLLQRDIIAPLLPGGKIRTRLGGLVYEFKLQGSFVGWGRFRPLNEREAEVVGEAMPWERGGYLELFPALRMLLLWPDHSSRFPGTWWALPFNESDARQRFGFAMEPYPVFLCDPAGGAERFERVIVRVDGRTLWFDGPDVLADPAHAEWLRDAAARSTEIEDFLPGLAASERQAFLLWHIHQLELSSHARQKERQCSQLESRLQYALSKAGAILCSYQEVTRPDGSLEYIMVEWSVHDSPYRYRSAIDASLTVVSSGICLSGRDSDFDLTSLVDVVTDGPW